MEIKGYKLIKRKFRTKEKMIKYFIKEGMCPNGIGLLEDSCTCFSDTNPKGACTICWNEALDKEY